MTRTVFITGATGFLGSHIVDQLLAGGWRVTAMYRVGSRIEALTARGVRCVKADLQDSESLIAAMPDRVDAVLHVAANTSLWFRDAQQQWRDNVDGTRNICSAALARQAGKLVMLSSISAYGLRDDHFNEQSEQLGALAPIPYYRSKAQAEVEVRQAIAQGLAACIINPSHIIGPRDQRNWSRVFRLIQQQKLPGIPPGEGSFCYAPEVARAVIRAIDYGRSGDNYLLGGSELGFFDLVQKSGKLLQRRVPAKTTPAWALRSLGRCNDLLSLVTRREPELTYCGALIICSHARFASTRAQEVLDYRVTDIDTMLRETIAWMKTEGLLN